MNNTHSIDFERDFSQCSYILDNVPLSITADISIEMWVKFETLPSVVGSSNYLLSKYAGDVRSYTLGIDVNDKLFFIASDGGETPIYTSTTSTDAVVGSTGVWIHVAVTWDASEKLSGITLYKNGSPIAVTGGNNQTTTMMDSNVPFVVGGIGDNPPFSNYPDAKINNVRVFSDVRTPQEIIDNRYQVLTGTANNLVGSWYASETHDDLAGSNDLTALGSPVFSTDTPFWTGSQTVTAKGSIQRQFAQTITAKASIRKSFIQTVATKGRIQKQFIQTIQAKVSIKKFGQSQTITVKAAIQKQFSQTINSKARIEKEFSQTIQAKARITITSSQTVTAKGNISKPGNSTKLARITGQDTADKSKLARIHGQDTDNSARSAVIAGEYRMIAYPWQRKTWFEGARAWRALFNPTESRIEFWYSDDYAQSWTENTNARITDAGVSTDFFVRDKPTIQVVIAYSNGQDILIRENSGTYPGTAWAWEAASTITSGGANDKYIYPALALLKNIKWQVSYTHHDTNIADYYYIESRKSTTPNQTVNWDGITVLSNNTNASPNCFSSIGRVGVAQEDTLCVWVRDDALEYKEEDNGSWDVSATSIATVCGCYPEFGFALDNYTVSGEIHIVYVKADGTICENDFVHDSGLQGEEVLEATPGGRFPTVAEHSEGEAHYFWIRGTDLYTYQEGVGKSIVQGGLSRYASWLNVNQNASFEVLFVTWQEFDTINSIFVEGQSQDAREARIHGQDTDTNDRLARITGQVTDNSDKLARIHGQDTDASSRNARITGKTFTGERLARIHGQDTEVGEREARIHGEAVGTSDKNARITGQDTDNSGREARITGKTFTSERDARITGQDTGNSDKQARITGQDTAQDTKEARITGEITDNSDREARIHGQVTDNSNRLGRIHGKTTGISTKEARIHGQTTEDEVREVRITGKDTANSERDARVYGQDVAQDTKEARIHGQTTANSVRNARITGQVSDNSNRSARITGEAVISGRNAVIKGMAVISSERLATVTVVGIGSERSASIVGAKCPWFEKEDIDWQSKDEVDWFTRVKKKIYRQSRKIICNE